MSIPESQLETWSHQGSVTQSSSTYKSVKTVLEATTTPYANRKFKVFLQGSYGNDTNIYAESDVDVVIRLDSTYFDDTTALSEYEKELYKSQFIPATYYLSQFKNDVMSVLVRAYGNDVTEGEKAIQIAARGNRRKIDVIVAAEYRKYSSFNGFHDQAFTDGIRFLTLSNEEIINYPRQHSENLTLKHQASKSWLKPTVRIFKNMRNKMIERSIISKGIAPSYYIEGLLYNVPASELGGTYENCVVSSLNWIIESDKSKLLCANEQYYLCHPGSPVTWRAEKRDAFLSGAVELWENW